MNLLKLTFCLVLAIGFMACDKDDKNCTQADWVGTYEGTIECDGVEEDVVVRITASGSENIIIEYETSVLIVEYDPLNPDECNLDYSASDSGITLSVDASLNGDNFTLEERYTALGITATCNITATR